MNTGRALRVFGLLSIAAALQRSYHPRVPSRGSALHLFRRAGALNPFRRRKTSDKLYESWKVDVEGYEALEEPLVKVAPSPNAGNGVFATKDLAKGTTITEYVGLLAECPETRSGDLALYQSYYGKAWRSYAQRYEIGLTGSKIADAGGTARGGSVVAGTGASSCDPYEDLKACVTRAGEGAFLLLGKVDRADPREGVAQLINDHSTIRAPSNPGGSSTLKASDVDGLILKDSTWPYPPVAVDGAYLRAATEAYVAAIGPETNCALVQARTGLGTGLAAPRIFAVATRDIAAGEELRLTYGAEWWLAQLRRAALAQLVACGPSPQRAAALEKMIRAIEFVSCEAVAPQAEACARAGCMPRAFVVPLERLAPLDELLADDSWQKVLLSEEFVATECSVEELYADAFEANYT